ncbi:hypothetical protein AAG906_016429 [Vitis piasezkii]
MGHFEIFPWSGSCMPTESRGQRDLAGMSISLAGPDGRVLGGGLGGLLGLMALFRFWWEVFCQATSRSKSQTSRELSLWASLNSMQGSRNLDGDHKLPLSEGETKGPSQVGGLS